MRRSAKRVPVNEWPLSRRLYLFNDAVKTCGAKSETAMAIASAISKDELLDAIASGLLVVKSPISLDEQPSREHAI